MHSRKLRGVYVAAGIDLEDADLINAASRFGKVIDVVRLPMQATEQIASSLALPLASGSSDRAAAAEDNAKKLTAALGGRYVLMTHLDDSIRFSRHAPRRHVHPMSIAARLQGPARVLRLARVAFRNTALPLPDTVVYALNKRRETWGPHSAPGCSHWVSWPSLGWAAASFDSPEKCFAALGSFNLGNSPPSGGETDIFLSFRKAVLRRDIEIQRWLRRKRRFCDATSAFEDSSADESDSDSSDFLTSDDTSCSDKLPDREDLMAVVRSPSPGLPEVDESKLPLVTGVEIVGKLGQGNNSLVYLGRRSDGSELVVKAISELSVHAKREMIAAKFVSSIPYAPRIYGSRRGIGCTFLLVELLGPDLLALSDKYNLTELEVLVLSLEMLSALRALHCAGLIHRSVKPENFCLAYPSTATLSADGSENNAEDNTRPLVKIIDFGRTVFSSQQSPDVADDEPLTGWWYTLPGFLGEPLTEKDDLGSLVHCIGYLIDDQMSDRQAGRDGDHTCYAEWRKRYAEAVRDCMDNIEAEELARLSRVGPPVPPAMTQLEVAGRARLALRGIQDAYYPPHMPVWWLELRRVALAAAEDPSTSFASLEVSLRGILEGMLLEKLADDRQRGGSGTVADVLRSIIELNERYLANERPRKVAKRARSAQ
jgi:hypothetical protein